ncbi:MAG TPA: GNAT family N-acetyltransferase [Chthoniobacterales bacterium]
MRRLAASLKKRHPATIRTGDLKNFRVEADRLREIYNDAWKDNWGFVPFTEKEFQFMAKELKQLVVPEFTLVAEVADEPAGFILCVPDINVALKNINGRLTTWGIPIGLTKLLYYKSRIRTARLIALGVKPKYRRGGIAEMLVLGIIEEAMIKRGFTGELSMTLENNHLINRFLSAIGARKYKTYRIYRRGLRDRAG